MPVAGRFAFTDTLKTGQQVLTLAQLRRSGWPRPSAGIVREMGRVPGGRGFGGAVPEEYVSILPSPSSRYLAALSLQSGIDFLDFNVHVYAMETGAHTAFYNEHRFTDTNRSNCPSPLFDAFLAAEAAFGVPPAELDRYDYVVQAEGTSPSGRILGWSASETLLLGYQYDIFVTPGGLALGSESFVFEVDPARAATLSRNGGIAPMPQPANRFGISPHMPRVRPHITLKRSSVTFVRTLLSPRFDTYPRVQPADRVVGYLT